jgi:hypothetical protein
MVRSQRLGRTKKGSSSSGPKERNILDDASAGASLRVEIPAVAANSSLRRRREEEENTASPNPAPNKTNKNNKTRNGAGTGSSINTNAVPKRRVLANISTVPSHRVRVVRVVGSPPPTNTTVRGTSKSNASNSSASKKSRASNSSTSSRSAAETIIPSPTAPAYTAQARPFIAIPLTATGASLSSTRVPEVARNVMNSPPPPSPAAVVTPTPVVVTPPPQATPRAGTLAAFLSLNSIVGATALDGTEFKTYSLTRKFDFEAPLDRAKSTGREFMKVGLGAMKKHWIMRSCTCLQ